MKLHFSSLGIEVTRRCNMHCAHCLRGDAIDADADMDYICKLLDQTDAIDSITFTGGEPSLVPEILIRTLEEVKARDIPVSSFYVVTNGKEVPNEFLHALMDWYVYCAECNGDLDMCGVALSKDKYHDNIPAKNVFKLQAFNFFTEEKYTDWDKHPVIARGRGRQLKNSQERNLYTELEGVEQYQDMFYIPEIVVLTVNGDLLADCDYEYRNDAACKVGNVKEMDAFLQHLEGLALECAG